MSKLFLTNPSQPSHLLTKDENLIWNFKEAVTAELIKCGVPFRIAELAVIDLKKFLILAQHNKLTAEQTANMLMCEVERLYKNNEGIWHFSGKA